MKGARDEYLQYRLERSNELFQDAQLLAENRRWRSCINRLYYSSFHLISGLLFQKDITTKSHDGLKTKFLQLYIKSNLIELEYGKLYSKLIDWRQESDYSVNIEFKEEDVIPLIIKVEKFNQILREKIKI
ncbi:MAG: HEPN domain-containing protein [Bacteroidales bacterium]|nr:HEPN domain-containing protein [Bacteroidales bacterium]